MFGIDVCKCAKRPMELFLWSDDTKRKTRSDAGTTWHQESMRAGRKAGWHGAECNKHSINISIFLIL